MSDPQDSSKNNMILKRNQTEIRGSNIPLQNSESSTVSSMNLHHISVRELFLMRVASTLGALWFLIVLLARPGQAAVDSQMVVGIDWDRDDPRAYPLETLNFHEIVNDIDSLNRSFAVTWAPLTGSNVIFRTQDLYSRNKQLGHSGKLYQNNLIAYDRATHSLWSQLLRLTVAGVARGEKLLIEHSSLTKWSTWKKLYPNTRVLSRPSGSRRNYFQDPYKHYRQEDRIMFPSCFADHYNQIPYSLKKSKELTLIVFTDSDNPILFPYSELAKQRVVNTKNPTTDETVLVVYDVAHQFVASYVPEINSSLLLFEVAQPDQIPSGINYTDVSRGGLMLFSDLNTKSVWNVMGDCIAGPLHGHRLRRLTSFTVYWFAASTFFGSEYIFYKDIVHKWQPDTICPPISNDTACLVPCSEILSAGPDEDVIVSIDRPTWQTPDQYEYLERTPWNIVLPYFIIFLTLFFLFIGLMSWRMLPCVNRETHSHQSAPGVAFQKLQADASIKSPKKRARALAMESRRVINFKDDDED